MNTQKNYIPTFKNPCPCKRCGLNTEKAYRLKNSNFNYCFNCMDSIMLSTVQLFKNGFIVKKLVKTA